MKHDAVFLPALAQAQPVVGGVGTGRNEELIARRSKGLNYMEMKGREEHISYSLHCNRTKEAETRER